MNVFAAAITTAFIPVFTLVRQQSGQTAAWQLTNRLLSLVSIVVASVAVVAFIFMPTLSFVIAPGFSVSQHQLLTQASRLMLLSPILFSLSIVFGSTLQAVEHFISYALSPLFYNAGIVTGIIWLAPRFGIIGVVYGVILGASLHMIVRLLALQRTSWQWQFHWRWLATWRDPTIHHLINLMLPRIGALLAVQINLWLYNAFGSTLSTGSITIFNLARNFQSLPVSAAGIALATAAFPALASRFAADQPKEFTHQLRQTLRLIWFFTIPAGVGMMVLAQPIIALFLGTGKFTDAAIMSTAGIVMIFAVSIPWESSQHILARAFYAQHDTIRPVMITILATVGNVLACWLGSYWFGVNGLSGAFVIMTIIQALGLGWWLQHRTGQWLDKSLLQYLCLIIVASILMGLVVWVSQSLLLGVLTGTITYIIVCRLFKILPV